MKRGVWWHFVVGTWGLETFRARQPFEFGGLAIILDAGIYIYISENRPTKSWYVVCRISWYYIAISILRWLIFDFETISIKLKNTKNTKKNISTISSRIVFFFCGWGGIFASILVAESAGYRFQVSTTTNQHKDSVPESCHVSSQLATAIMVETSPDGRFRFVKASTSTPLLLRWSWVCSLLAFSTTPRGIHLEKAVVSLGVIDDGNEMSTRACFVGASPAKYWHGTYQSYSQRRPRSYSRFTVDSIRLMLVSWRASPSFSVE